MSRKFKSSVCLFIITFFLNSTVLWAGHTPTKHYFILVDDLGVKSKGKESDDFEDFEILDVAVEDNYNSVLKISAKHGSSKTKLFYILFENPKDSKKIEKFMTLFSKSYDIRILKSDYSKVVEQKSSEKGLKLIPAHIVKFLDTHKGKLIAIEAPIKEWEAGPSPSPAVDKKVTADKTSKSLFKKLGHSFHGIFHSSTKPISPTPHHSSDPALDAVEMLEEPLKVFRKTAEEALLDHDPHHLSASYLAYLKQNKVELEKNQEFLTKARDYIVTGTHYSHRRGAVECPEVKPDKAKSNREILQTVIGFASCFADKSDAEILLGNWGEVNIDRGQFNSYVDMITTPFTSYTYIKAPLRPFPNTEDLKSRILSAISSSISHLNRISGAVSLLESKAKTGEISPLHFMDLLILIPEVTKDLQASIGFLQELKVLKEVDQSFLIKLDRLQQSMTLLEKFLKRAKSKICSDPYGRAEIIDSLPHACDES
ncbi:MAG: hypothetical protein ABIQ95_02115 [Bdellovibrionia bacterium]